MEKIDVRGCFPVMNGGDGVILSKRGDVCYGWEVVLPPAFRCNEQRYDAIVQDLFSAVTLLPDYAIVHKQDVYMKKKYVAEKSDGLLQEAPLTFFFDENIRNNLHLWSRYSLPSKCLSYRPHRTACWQCR